MSKGWLERPLDDVCEFINRGISPVYIDEGGVRVLNQKCVRDHSVNYDLARRHDADAKRVAQDRIIRIGDVLVNSTGTGTVGRVAQIRQRPSEPTTIDSHVTIVRPKPGMFYDEFFGYALVAIEDQIKVGGEGCGGQVELSRSKLASDYPIRYPVELPEQKRIVAILDEAFEAIAVATANAEKNLANARELYERHLENALSDFGKNYKHVSIDSLTKLARGHNPPKSTFSRELKPGYIRFYQIRDGGTDDYTVYVPDTPQLHKMNKDDIMMVAYRHVGRAFRGVEGAFNVALCKVSNARRDILDDDYLFCIIPSKFVRGELLKQSERSLIPSMSIENLRELVIPLPPLNLQQNFVKLLMDLSERTERLESIYQQKLDSLAELKQSLLQRAFSGELTANQPLTAAA